MIDVCDNAYSGLHSIETKVHQFTYFNTSLIQNYSLMRIALTYSQLYSTSIVCYSLASSDFPVWFDLLVQVELHLWL